MAEGRAAAAALANVTARLRQEQEESDKLRKQLAQAESRAREAERAASEAEATRAEAEAAAEARGGGPPGPVVEWFRSWDHQYFMALVVGVLGVLSVGGPSPVVRLWSPTAGCLLGGLLAASLASFVAAEAAGSAGILSWFDSAAALVSGNGQVLEYLMWACVTVFGLLRWLFQWDCLLYARPVDVDLEEAPELDELTALKEPLLPGLSQVDLLDSVRGWGEKLCNGSGLLRGKSKDQDDLPSESVALTADRGVASTNGADEAARPEGHHQTEEEEEEEDEDEASEEDVETAGSPEQHGGRPACTGQTSASLAQGSRANTELGSRRNTPALHEQAEAACALQHQTHSQRMERDMV